MTFGIIILIAPHGIGLVGPPLMVIQALLAILQQESSTPTLLITTEIFGSIVA